jgi:hypothetical protein
MLDRSVDEPLDAGEGDDLVELGGDLAPPHAENRAVHEDVLASGQLGMKSGPDLEQRPDPTRDVDVSFARLGDPRQDLQQRALPRAVPTDDAQDLAVAHLERGIAERPDCLAFTRCVGCRLAPKQRSWSRHDSRDRITQRPVAFARADSVELAQALRANDRSHQTMSANVRSVRLK